MIQAEQETLNNQEDTTTIQQNENRISSIAESLAKSISSNNDLNIKHTYTERFIITKEQRDQIINIEKQIENSLGSYSDKRGYKSKIVRNAIDFYFKYKLLLEMFEDMDNLGILKLNELLSIMINLEEIRKDTVTGYLPRNDGIYKIFDYVRDVNNEYGSLKLKLVREK